MALFCTNLLVIQHSKTLYLGGNHVRVVYEKVCRNAQDCALKQGLAIGCRDWQAARGCTQVKHVEKLNHYANCSTTRQKVQTGHSISSQLELATQLSRQLALF